MTQMLRWLGLGLAAATLAAAPIDEKANISLDDAKLAAMSKAAKTAQDHLELARVYRERAAEFEAKARRHETKADELTRQVSYNPLRHKWPAMAHGPADRERNLAMQARRAAKESLQLAERHEETARKLASSEGRYQARA